MNYPHKNMVKSIADELVSAGLVGRADHIGVHPFLFFIIQSKNLTESRIHKKMLGGGFRSGQSILEKKKKED